MPRDEAHAPPGHLHLAVSTQFVDPRGNLLLQRRAPGKRLFAGLWANSACTHPLPGETTVAAASRRAREELGLDVRSLAHVGRFTYRAEDRASGLVEHEVDHVFAAVIERDAGAVTVDAEEIAEIGWFTRADAVALAATPAAAPWLCEVLELTATWLDRDPGDGAPPGRGSH